MRRRISLAVLLLVLAYVALLAFPQPLFAYRVQVGSLALYSDGPFDATAGEAALRLAHAKLVKSPLYKGRAAAAYVCNSAWRRRLLFSYQAGAGGVAYPAITANVYLRGARIGENRLLGPSGNVVVGVRTLDYYIAHEIGHVITGEYLGAWRYHRLPQWVREGYADYVGKGGDFNYGEARAAMMEDAREMDWRRSGLYTRFHLYCAHLLDRRGWTVEKLLTEPPPVEQVEAWVREER
jgi:hypothetical protein